MDVPVADADTVEILRQLFGHALGQRGDEYPLSLLGPELYLVHKVVYLIFGRPHGDGRVHQTRRPDELLHDGPFALGKLVVGRRSAHVNGSTRQRFELAEGEGTVVLGRREPETVLHEALLAGTVAAVHGPYLRNGYMALVDDQQVVFRKVVQQAEGARPLLPSVQITGIVFDAGTVAELLYHLQVILHALFDTLCLHHPARLLEEADSFAEVELYLLDGPVGAFPRRHEHVGGKYRHRVESFKYLSACRVDACDLFHFVVEHRDAVNRIAVCRHDVDDLAVHPEGTALEFRLGAGIEGIHKSVEDFLAAGSLACRQLHARSVEILRVPDTVETRHARYHDNIPAPGKERGRGTQTQFLYLLVDGEVFFDIGIGGRKIGFRLVIIVIRDEILHGILREERLEFAVKLCRQRLVVAQDERGPLQLGDDIRNGECLPGTGDAKQGIVPAVPVDGTDEFGDGLGLVAGRFIIGY